MRSNLLNITNMFIIKNLKRQRTSNILLLFLAITGMGILSLILITYSLPNISSTENVQVLMLFLVAIICWMGMTYTNRTIRDARSQDANLEAVLNHISDGVLIRDLQGNFLSANPALLQMIPEAELRDMNFSAFEKTMPWKRKFFTITTTHIPEVGSIVIFRDQTRCRETEQARDALLATVSHEFRTPLAAVMNYLEMLLMLAKMKKIDSEAFIAHLTRALENSQRLQHLVGNIIEQAQLQAGALGIKTQRFNLPELLEKNGQLFSASLKQKGLSYKLSIAPNVPVEIRNDPERLQQVLAKLIENAIKFTSQGEIKIRVFMQVNEKVAIEIIDTGIGIPDEQLPAIFEVFRRGSNYAQREHQGAGLGLSIAKQVITSMGGEITVCSTLGLGSTFTICLPANKVN